MKLNQEAVRRNLKIDPKAATGQFVIFHEAKEEFLGSVDDKGDLNLLGWVNHPSAAIIYDSPDYAVAEAKRIALNQGYTLDICELHHTPQGVALAPLLFVKPDNDKPKQPIFH